MGICSGSPLPKTSRRLLPQKPRGTSFYPSHVFPIHSVSTPASGRSSLEGGVVVRETSRFHFRHTSAVQLHFRRTSANRHTSDPRTEDNREPYVLNLFYIYRTISLFVIYHTISYFDYLSYHFIIFGGKTPHYIYVPTCQEISLFCSLWISCQVRLCIM